MKKYLYLLSLPILFIQPYIVITLVLKNITDITQHYNNIKNKKINKNNKAEMIIFYLEIILFYLSIIYPNLLIIANTFLIIETTLEIINTTKYLVHTYLANNKNINTKPSTTSNQTIEKQKIQSHTKNKENNIIYENNIPTIQDKKEKVLELQKKNH